MPLLIVRNDITEMNVDAIVNTANPLPMVGSGVDHAIYKKAGCREHRNAQSSLQRTIAPIQAPLLTIQAPLLIILERRRWRAFVFGCA